MSAQQMVLVTGGAGFIGSHTVARLVARGAAVVVLDNLSRGHRWAVPDGVPLVVGDIADVGLVTRVLRQHGATAVIHFAAASQVGESMREPRLYYANNVGGTLRLLDAMLGAGVDRIVFSSTAAVYGEPSQIPIPETHPRAQTRSGGHGTRTPVRRVIRLLPGGHIHHPFHCCVGDRARPPWARSILLQGRQPAVQKPIAPTRCLLRGDVQLIGDLPVLESVRSPQHDARTLHKTGGQRARSGVLLQGFSLFRIQYDGPSNAHLCRPLL